MNEESQQPPIEVPLSALSADALCGMIESFILREGTDYGVNEVTLESKIKQVRKQLEYGDIKIVFDPNTESATLVTMSEWKKLSRLIK